MDNLMVQCVESRYRKKFFATVFYSRDHADVEKGRRLAAFAAQLEVEAMAGLENVLAPR
jgi:hypothetical protein